MPKKKRHNRPETDSKRRIIDDIDKKTRKYGPLHMLLEEESEEFEMPDEFDDFEEFEEEQER